MIKAVIFDHDGTIVDSEPIHAKLWIEILKVYGVDFSEKEYFSKYAGIPTVINAETMVSTFKLPISPKQLADEKSAKTKSYLTETAFPLKEGMMGLFKYFQNKNVKMAVVTGADRYSVDKTLKTYNLESFFDVIVSGEDVQSRKPDPECYNLVVSKLGVSNRECLVLEDSDAGFEASKGAGMRCCINSTHPDFVQTTKKHYNMFNRMYQDFPGKQKEPLSEEDQKKR